VAGRPFSSALLNHPRALAPPSPIFLELALHWRRRGVLELEPVARATGHVTRAQVFRDDPVLLPRNLRQHAAGARAAQFIVVRLSTAGEHLRVEFRRIILDRLGATDRASADFGLGGQLLAHFAGSVFNLPVT
jgi:hypothetical protein